MRAFQITNGLKVQAIAGTYVVILGFDLPEADCEGLLGFSIHRYDHNENEAYYLEGMKSFKETDPGFPAGSLYSTRNHPVQSFQWADYSAKPGYKYTYTVTALKGKPEKLEVFAEIKVVVITESPESGDHDVYFNRGISASQEYVRRFGDNKPEDVPNHKAFDWLSRGLYEALECFVNTCIPGQHSLRIAAYEFNYVPFLKLLKDTSDKGVDIKIIYDARKKSPGDDNKQKVIDNHLEELCKERTEGKSYISHNKFIVKLENEKPVAVWTGSTNFSEGGIFGHSNVAHVVEEEGIAKSYFEYWKFLSEDPKTKEIKSEVESLTPLPKLPLSKGSLCIFSPRKNLEALGLYHDLALTANSGLFMTFAFGMNDIFKEVYDKSTCSLRFALLESKTRPMKEGPEKDAEEQAIQNLRNKQENVFAIGDFIKTNKFDGWVKEKLSGLNAYVKYIHDKFMLIDPLGDNPIVVTGSANFSDASTVNNDENMIVICGNKRIADIYLGEYMRLFSHYSFRESLKWRKADEQPKSLRTDDWWHDYFGNASRSKRREFFTQMK